MVSKTFIYFCLLLVIVLLISSEVATDAAEATMNPNGVRDAKYGGGYQGDPGRGEYGGGYQGDPGRGGYGGYPGRGGYGSRGGFGGGGRGRNGGGRCYYGCCRWSYSGRECVRCCNHPGQAVDTQPHNQSIS
ncbi:hypothetical protein ACFX13_024826 [Malus domestica]|uniref:glycine-rich protein-like n=1 Tax=Malus sylvestris TaxID=3752 RepID=UPI0010A9A613|nr:glycine-rich protein-like [Malus domestica]XP_050133817.1 glycine-rich protein-like [Malus sylvestris]